MKKLIAYIFIFNIVGYSLAQSPQFSQFYAAPLYLNPALTGATKGGRIALNYRNQWPASGATFNTGAFSFDYNLRSISSGLGLLVVNDRVDDNGLTFTSVGATYAYITNITRKHSVRVGLKASQNWSGIKSSSLIFADQLINQTNSSNSLAGLQPTISYFDDVVGGVFYSNNCWVGLAFDHLTRPNQSYYGANDELPLKYSFHAGYTMPLTKNIKGFTTSKMTLTFNYKAQKKWDQLDLGFYYTKNPIVLGLWYRGLPFKNNPQNTSNYSNRESLVFLFGIEVNEFRIGYSYDLLMSQLAPFSGGAHELSLTYSWGEDKRSMKRRIMLVPCAKF